MTQTIEVSIAGLHQLYTRIGQQQLDKDDWPVVGALVAKLLVREEAKMSRMVAKAAAEAAAAAAAEDGETIDVEHKSVDDGDDVGEHEAPTGGSTAGAQNSGSGAAGEPSSGAPPPANTPDPPKKIKNHGRNGVAAYTNAKHVVHALMLGILGALCECGKACMTKYREKITIRIIGQPLFGVEVHHYDQARCKMCGKIIRASGPTTVMDGLGTNYVVYDWSACAMLIVMHYFGGAPFKRLESLHAGWGIPFADANQWSTVDKCDDLLQPLYKALEIYGMGAATNLRIDDTGSMVIEVMRQIKATTAALKLLGERTDKVRTGINTTGVYLETPSGTVILFFTGLHHAGEILDLLLRHRQPEGPKLVKVTDGASKNFNPRHVDRLIEGVCNAHAYLKFYDVKAKHPAEYAVAGEVYKQVFDNEKVSKASAMTPQQRLDFHKKHSLPLMEKLKAMCVALVTSRLAEPNSKLWAPVTFIINQWPRLTKFCKEPGVPLDSNLVEQILITPVRYLAGSFNYKTMNGAEVGDRHMSLIASARANGAEPVAYLDDCLRNHEDLKKRPEYYLPWVYYERMRPPDVIQKSVP